MLEPGYVIWGGAMASKNGNVIRSGELAMAREAENCLNRKRLDSYSSFSPGDLLEKNLNCRVNVT